MISTEISYDVATQDNIFLFEFINRGSYIIEFIKAHWGKVIKCEACLHFIVFSQSILIHRGSYMSAHVLLNLISKLGKRDKM